MSAPRNRAETGRVAIHGRDHVDDCAHLAIGANLHGTLVRVWRKSSRATCWCSVSITTTGIPPRSGVTLSLGECRAGQDAQHGRPG